MGQVTNGIVTGYLPTVIRSQTTQAMNVIGLDT